MVIIQQTQMSSSFGNIEQYKFIENKILTSIQQDFQNFKTPPHYDVFR